MNKCKRDAQISLGKILIALASCFSLTSILFPFSTVTYYSIIHEDAYLVNYWSYKATITYIRLGYAFKNEIIFLDTYWFEVGKPYSYPSLADLKVSWITIAIFLAQILTLCLSIVAFLLKRGKIKVLPFISCLSIDFLMLGMVTQIQNQTYCQQKFELGFWLTSASVFLFMLGALLRKH